MVLFAAMLVALVGFTALSIDVGYFLSQRRAVQNAADAAVMAGGRYLIQQTNPTSTSAQTGAVAAVAAYAAADGFTGGASGTTVLTTFPASDEIAVTVTYAVPKFFIGVIYHGAWNVQATATARFPTTPSPYALIALGQSPAPGITFGGIGGSSGNGVIIQCTPPAAGCGSIGSNSNITMNGNNYGDVGGVLGAVGTVDSVPSTFSTYGTYGGQGVIPDPFLPISAPDCTSMAQDPTPDNSVSGVWTLSPGHYTKFNPPGNVKTFVLAAGVYCFDTNIKLNSSQTSWTATAGVMMYFHNGYTFAPGNVNLYINDSKYAGLDTGNSKWNTIAVWIDNSCSSLTSLALNGSGNMTINGAIYAPCTDISLGGNNGSKAVTGAVVGYDIKIAGSVTFNMNTNSDYNAGPPQVYLVH